MKVTFRLFPWLVACLAALPSSLLAGDMYLLTLKGTVYEVNGSGKIGGTAITQSTIIKNIAQRAGIPASNLALVYHVGGNAMGDTIDVIDRTNGQVLDTLYGFYFGTAFARRALYTADGKEERRLDYIYTRQAGVALGSATVTKKPVRIKGGSRLYIGGSMQWIVMPEWENPGQICTAKFTTGAKLSW